MRLDRVEIKNFRSIDDVTINFDPSCRVLVGINESGKSNILKALALLSDEYDPSKQDDLREALPDEDPIEESYVKFVFSFGKGESDHLLEMTSNKVLSTTKNPKIVLSGSSQMNLKDFCASQTGGLYSADILTEQKSFKYWKIADKYKILDGWKKPSKACPADFSVQVKEQKYLLSKFSLLSADVVSEVPSTHLEDATMEDLSSLVGNTIIQILKDNVPDTLFWEYDENNLLPGSIKIEDFAANPNSCPPLRNMFVLAGIDDIKSSINEKKAGTENQFQNYLDGVAKKTTNHFRSVWKEYKNIEFSLRLNADKIIPGVKEKNTHDFARRSDGFKRFVTFLLMISVNVKTEKLRNTLLLIDEPDASLHPTGARYLRDELIKISKTNYVIYSTHSIFMIDSSDVARHYIVKKKDEITSIESAHTSNIADEEVIYNALGYSLFEILKEKNIIFEGWTDKRLFNVALENSSSEIKKKFKDVGICHAKGVKTIRTITPMIELAKRGCLVISDCDSPAKDHQKIYRQEKCFGDWKTYQEVDGEIEAITAEDFLKNDFIVKQINALKLSNMPVFAATVLPEKKGKAAAILKWLTENGMTSEQAKDTVSQIKTVIFDSLKHSNIEDTYSKILNGITL